jgi:hypothetical protein
MQKQINSVKEFHIFKIGHSEIKLPRWEKAKYAKVSFDERRK